MKITIYDLIKLVKEGKAPKYIKFENYKYIWKNESSNYFCEQLNHYLTHFIGDDLFINLDLGVEIIEEDKEIEKVELFKIYQEYIEKNFSVQMTNILTDIEAIFNELIDEINKLKKDK